MEKIKQILRNILNGVDKSWFARAYLFSILLSSLLIYLTKGKFKLMVSAVIWALLYPFSKLIYEEVTSFILGKNTFKSDKKIYVFLKIFINLALYVFSPFIAPIGFIFLYFKTK